MHARQARKDGALRGRTVLAQTPSGVLCLSAYSCSTTLRTVFLLSPPNLGFGAHSSVVEQICTRVLKFLVSQLEKKLRAISSTCVRRQRRRERGFETWPGGTHGVVAGVCGRYKETCTGYGRYTRRQWRTSRGGQMSTADTESPGNEKSILRWPLHKCTATCPFSSQRQRPLLLLLSLILLH
jgi:hypothetical protein